MIGTMFDTIVEAIQEFGSALGSALTQVTSLFYTPGANGAEGTWTVLGVLLLVAVGVGIVYFAFRLIMSLVGRARA